METWVYWYCETSSEHLGVTRPETLNCFPVFSVVSVSEVERNEFYFIAVFRNVTAKMFPDATLAETHAHKFHLKVSAF